MASARGRRRYKLKICSVGEEAVGKTSLIRRFVADKFDADYIRTIGTLISKKTVALEDPSGESLEVDAVLWDIMGKQGFMDLLKDAYFYKANGVLAVCDLARGDTLEALDGWLHGVYDTTGEIAAAILVNKADLTEESAVEEKAVAALSERYHAPYTYTSAKTGENVAAAFKGLLQAILAEDPKPLRVALKATPGGG